MAEIGKAFISARNYGNEEFGSKWQKLSKRSFRLKMSRSPSGVKSGSRSPSGVQIRQPLAERDVN